MSGISAVSYTHLAVPQVAVELQHHGHEGCYAPAISQEVEPVKEMCIRDRPRDVRRTVMSTIWVRLMQSTYGRAAVAGVAAVLALTMWRTGALTFVTDHGSDLQALLPTVQVTLPEKQPPKILPEKLGRPVTSRPGENIYTRVSSVLESLLNAAENIKS